MFCLRDKRSVATVVGFGGLGNQLFGWALAGALCKQGIDAEIALPREFPGNKTHGMENQILSAFNLRVPTFTPRAIPFRLRVGLGLRYPIFSKIFRIVASDALSWSQLISFARRGYTLAGYHQTPDAVAWLGEDDCRAGVVFRENRPESRLKTISDWSTTLIVHVRGGDFKMHDDSLGLLSDSYFELAAHQMLKLRDARDINRIAIVTDDVQRGEEVASRLLSTEKEVQIIGPRDFSSVEAFHCLTSSNFLIISNSTFSYWAGRTGNKAKRVIYPSPWSRNSSLDLSDAMFPEDWTSCESGLTPKKL